MKIALAQMNCELGAVDANMARVAYFAEVAGRQHADLVVFPEVIDIGFDQDLITKNANAENGFTYQNAAAIAAEVKIAMVCGFSERAGDKLYNTFAAFSKEGRLIAKYRKIHLFAHEPIREDAYFTAGNTPVTFQLDDMTFGLMICYDLRFPALGAFLADSGADALVCCAAWPVQRVAHWQLLTTTRALENQCYMLAVNRVGIDTSVHYAGTSRVVSPMGETIAQGSPDHEELVVAEISAKTAREARATMPVIAGRRHDLYRQWYNSLVSRASLREKNR